MATNFESFLEEAKRLIIRETKRKHKEFKKFILDVESYLSSETKEKYEKFKEFAETADRIIQDAKNQNKTDFENFINNLEKYIYKEVEGWKEEKKLFEIYQKKQEVNIFEAFNTEEPYRDFLIWLLNPEGSHRLGDRFTKLFVNYIAKNKFNKKPLPNNKFEKVKIKKEDLGIDFGILGNNFYCAVEMKLKGGVSKEKLKEYYKALFSNENAPYKNKETKLMVCLDPKLSEDEKLDGVEFKPMNWWELALLLGEIYDNAHPDVQSLIRQFIKKVFTFAEEISKFDKKEEIMTKKRWFEIYSRISNKTGGKNGRNNL